MGGLGTGMVWGFLGFEPFLHTPLLQLPGTIFTPKQLSWLLSPDPAEP